MRYSQCRMPRRRFIVITVAVAGLLGLMIAVAQWLWQDLTASKMFKISHIRIITHGERVSPKTIAHLISSYIARNKSNFFSVNLSALQQEVQKNPWIAQVAFRREWPGSLAVTVTERKPIARWGDHAFVTAEGCLFYPSSKALLLTPFPTLQGPPESTREVLQTYKILTQKLRPLGLQLEKLKTNEQHVWEFVLENGLTVCLGSEGIPHRIDQFVNLYVNVIAKNEHTATRVDFRYPNGVAIAWKEK